MKTITFDFDDTLSNESVQKYAKKLIDQGYHVMIVTSRIEDKLKHLHPFSKSNADIYSVAKKLGISKSDIKFTNRQSKSIKLPSYNSSVHLENDTKELMDDGRTCLLLAPRVEALEYLQKLIPRSVVLTLGYPASYNDSYLGAS
jgi:DNA-directed RNA polymerase specialized sigma subunit